MSPIRPRAALLGAGLVLVAAWPSQADPAQTRPPAEGYVLHCSGCHGPEGYGAPGATPSLHALASLLALPGGREYVARVPGVAQAPVGDAELAALLNWVIQRFSDGAATQPFSAEEIGALRRVPLRDTAAARAALLR